MTSFQLPESFRRAAILVAAAAVFALTSGNAPGQIPGSDPALQDPLADPDRDGRNNLLEYAVGLDPYVPDSGMSHLVVDRSSLRTGVLSISFTRRKHRDQLTYRPEFSTDLKNWGVLPLSIESVTEIDAEFERVACSLSLEGRQRVQGFVRLGIDFRPIAGRFERESDAVDAFLQSRIRIEGTVVDSFGNAIAGARIVADSDVTTVGDEISTLSGDDGSFSFSGLPRGNHLLEISALGFVREVIPVHGHLRLDGGVSAVAPVRLRPLNPTGVRFLFAGDTSFGRRFVNPDATSGPEDPDRFAVPPDRPDALIQVSDPLPGAISCAAFMKPLFDAADYRIVNLETPILAEPATSHLTKRFSFYTLPGTLPALNWLGVEYVSLGNNHTFDYLETGVVETLANVSAAGLFQSGLGLDGDSAFQPFVKEMHGSDYAFISACSVSGTANPPIYLATSDKGGAADLRDTERMHASIGSAAGNGQIVIAQLHTGKEYSRSASDYARGRMLAAADSGAHLVIGHHTHVAQGFELYDGVLIAHSLGNFIFDQQRLETLLGLVVQVDMDGGTATGASAIPVYIEDFRPRMITGALADRFIRRIAGVSSLPLIPVHGRAKISLTLTDFEIEERELSIPVEVSSDGWAVVDLRRWMKSEEHLASMVSPDAELTGRLGRDLMLFGGMEESDLDDADNDGEASRWWRAGGAYRGLNHPFAGAVALYSTGTRLTPELLAYFAPTADGVLLGDGETLLNEGEVSVFDAPNGSFDLLHDESEPFGGVAFFESLGAAAVESVDIDALFIHEDGRISFSTTTDFTTTLLGTVKDGSAVTYDASVSLEDPASLVLLLDEDVLFPDLPGGINNNQDLDALHIDEMGRIYFSVVADGILNGTFAGDLMIRDGDIVRFDPVSGLAEIYLSEEAMLVEDGDIVAFSIDPEGNPAFSVSSTATLAGPEKVRLVDGAIGGYDLDRQSGSALLLQSDLFDLSAAAQADVNALHLAAHPSPPAPTAPPSQIAFRNRIRVEGDPYHTPNKDLTALGYLWLQDNGPMSLVANYYASFGDKGPETFGSEIVFAHEGGGSAAWRFFAHDLSLPPDDSAAIEPEADNARAVRLFLNHIKPEKGTGLVGIDELALVSWEVDETGGPLRYSLNSATSFQQHNRDFIRIEGSAGFYRLNLKLRRLVPSSG